MKLSIVGIGMGNPDLLTVQAVKAIEAADCLIGAKRLLDCFVLSAAAKHEAVTARQISDYIEQNPQFRAVCVLMSGDIGFYSGAKQLIERLGDRQAECICGISSLQYLCSRLQISWDDVNVVSLHGREHNLLQAVRTSPKTFVLTGSKPSIGEIGKLLTQNALGEVEVVVGERLSYSDERIVRCRADALCAEAFAPLSVLLLHNPQAQAAPLTHGLSDEAFVRGAVPMTKSEVRTVSIAKLALKQGQTVWDIGAGTGSVSVEIARVLTDGAVYAVEREEQACELLLRNKLRFGVENVHIIKGAAPQALEELPAPDAVFVGGSGGSLCQSLSIALEKNPQVRIVVNAITLETVGVVVACFTKFSLSQQEIVQLSVAKSHPAGKSHMMLGQNPVYILCAGGIKRDE